MSSREELALKLAMQSMSWHDYQTALRVSTELNRGPKCSQEDNPACYTSRDGPTCDGRRSVDGCCCYHIGSITYIYVLFHEQYNDLNANPNRMYPDVVYHVMDSVKNYRSDDSHFYITLGSQHHVVRGMLFEDVHYLEIGCSLVDATDILLLMPVLNKFTTLPLAAITLDVNRRLQSDDAGRLADLFRSWTTDAADTQVSFDHPATELTVQSFTDAMSTLPPGRASIKISFNRRFGENALTPTWTGPELVQIAVLARDMTRSISLNALNFPHVPVDILERVAAWPNFQRGREFLPFRFTFNQTETNVQQLCARYRYSWERPNVALAYFTAVELDEEEGGHNHTLVEHLVIWDCSRDFVQCISKEVERNDDTPAHYNMYSSRTSSDPLSTLKWLSQSIYNDATNTPLFSIHVRDLPDQMESTRTTSNVIWDILHTKRSEAPAVLSDVFLDEVHSNVLHAHFGPGSAALDAIRQNVRALFFDRVNPLPLPPPPP